MKKIRAIALVLALVLAFSLLTACAITINTPNDEQDGKLGSYCDCCPECKHNHDDCKCDCEACVCRTPGGNTPTGGGDDPSDKPNPTDKPAPTSDDEKPTAGPEEPIPTDPVPTDPPDSGGKSGPFDNLRIHLPENVYFAYDDYFEGKFLQEVAFVKVGNDICCRKKQEFLEREQYFFEYYKYTGGGWRVWFKNILDFSGFTLGIEGSDPVDNAVSIVADIISPDDWEYSQEDPDTEGAIFLYDMLNAICTYWAYTEIAGVEKNTTMDYLGVPCDIYNVGNAGYDHDPVSNLFFVMGDTDGNLTKMKVWNTSGVSFSAITPDIPE